MKKIILLLFSLQFVLAVAQKQTLKAQFVSNQKIDADEFVGFDSLENLYYIKNNVLFKKYKNELWQYKNISLGEITRVDILNPLRIVLFYENFNTIIMLDNQLNETQKINFSKNDIPIIVSATGNASQNKLWIYNSLSQQIGLFDYLNNNFHSITNSVQGNFKYYDSNLNTFEWIDNKNNWYSCDIFGKITSLGKISDFDQIQLVSDQVVIFSKDGKLYLQDLSKKSIQLIENVEKSFKNFFYKDQILSIFTNQEITNYKITIP
ncbi:MAG: hypothetical protein PHC28_03760 [Flavobacterium sp.]|uniref:hypothetical protein n=1 Tax=Flavobacterium sp. TaxID=239 RepID=UPI002622EBC0|nr:hypothetical protein [Flavobacterium sp.]MDD5149582.1 hypothetical protein [Flavobacterium sp.]